MISIFFSLSWPLHWSISITMCFPCRQNAESENFSSLSSMISERSEFLIGWETKMPW
jgi:hypothetical protein